MDYYPTFQPDSIRELVSDQTTVITISAKNGMNIPHLKEQLYASAISGEFLIWEKLQGRWMWRICWGIFFRSSVSESDPCKLKHPVVKFISVKN